MASSHRFCTRSTLPLTECANALRGDAAKARSTSPSARARSVEAELLHSLATRCTSTPANRLCASTDRGSSANARSNRLMASAVFLRAAPFARAARPRRM